MLDLSRVLAGPLRVMPSGPEADVVKVEHPKRDKTRRWSPPHLASWNTHFLCTNRNKRNVALDLNESGDHEGAMELAGMHHGGPYPASTSPLFTSVGHTAIRRFLRPVAYQNTPQALLPDELHDEPAEPIWRTVDGSLVHTGHDNTAAAIEEQEKTG